MNWPTGFGINGFADNILLLAGQTVLSGLSQNLRHVASTDHRDPIQALSLHRGKISVTYPERITEVWSSEPHLFDISSQSSHAF